MAELVFFSGPMDCGKSTLALQMAHTQSSHDREGQLFGSQDRSGTAVISSRIGLARPAIEVTADFNFWDHAILELMSRRHLDFLICDEAQFYAPAQVEDLARIVDELDIDVFCFGILADFRTELFPGSKRLVELADRMETLQVQPLCWCGQRATHNARVVDGVMVTEGDQVVVGDTASARPSEVHYEVLCRQHHRAGVTEEVAMATLSPDPLPFEE